MNINFIQSKIVCGFLLSNGEYIYKLHQPFFNKNVYVFHAENKPEIILFKLTDMAEKCNTELSYIYRKIKKNSEKFVNKVYQAEEILNKNPENYNSEYVLTIRTSTLFLTFEGCETLYKLFNKNYKGLTKRKLIEKTLHPKKLRKILLDNKNNSTSTSNLSVEQKTTLNTNTNNMYSYEDLLRIIKYQEDIIERKDNQVQQLQELCKTYVNDMNVFVQYTYNNHCDQYNYHLNNMNVLYKKFFEPVLNLKSIIENELQNELNIDK
jgi:hypothetical protein